MPLVQQILLALRALTEDEPRHPRTRRKRPNNGGRGNSRSRQTASLVLTFRDLFTTEGLNAFLDDMERGGRPRGFSNRNSFSSNNRANESRSRAESLRLNSPRYVTKVSEENQMVPVSAPVILNRQEETVPLLLEESDTISCRELVPSPFPVRPSGFFSSLSILPRKRNKSMSLTVPLNSDDENKTVETLRKVLKWSPRKQNSCKFAVTLPREEKHVAIAVVQNAVNIVKEEQQHKKKKKFFWLKLCKI